MASIWAKPFSSTWLGSMLAPPGSMLSMAEAPPILRIWANWASRSFMSNLFSIIRRAVSSAAFSSAASWARSIRLRISPMPRMRLAIRAGWKGSRSSSFSPVPWNLMGLPVTASTDRAAPPRVSPSVLVRMMPSTPTFSLKVWATLTASWPAMASTTSRVSSTGTACLIWTSSSISTSSICRRPAVSRITMSLP